MNAPELSPALSSWLTQRSASGPRTPLEQGFQNVGFTRQARSQVTRSRRSTESNGRKVQKRRDRGLVSCKTCGKATPVATRGPAKMYCDATCRTRFHEVAYLADGRHEAWAKTRAATLKAANLKHQTCRYCKSDFTDTRVRATCGTDECARRHMLDGAKQSRHKRRAQKNGTATEKIRAVEIFARDEYRCYLCGEETSGEWPEPLSPSLDHVIPLSKGGTHTQDNVKCAHLRCNVAKGARMPKGA